jgi:hypothetical protein
VNCGYVAPNANDKSYQMIKQRSRRNCGTFCFVRAEMMIEQEQNLITVMCTHCREVSAAMARKDGFTFKKPNGYGM